MINKKTHVFLPDDDGITHINVFPRGKTELGRLLAHFSKTPFVHPYLGAFNSMEGFWYYVRAKYPDEKLRTLSGPGAKFYGRNLEHRRFNEFKDIINDANYHKIDQNATIKKLLVESELPFDHYYFKGLGDDAAQHRPEGFDFLINGFTRCRELFKHGHKPLEIDYDTIFNKLRSMP